MARKWLMIGLALAAGVGLAVRAWLAPKTYMAVTVFHPDTGAGGTSGINVPDPLTFLMGGRETTASGQQIMGVLKSRSISEGIVADSIAWDGDTTLLADVVVQEAPFSFSPVRMVMRWFSANDSGPTYQSKLIHAGSLVRKGITTEMSEEGFINFFLGYYDPLLTQILAEKYIHHLEEYYTQQKTEKAQMNVDFFTQRADSVKKELDKVAASRARLMDQAQHRVFARDQIQAAELDVKLQMLQEMYIQLVASREQFIAQLKRETPVIQILDPPKPPFDVVGPSFIKSFLIGFVLAVFLLSLWFTRNLWIEDGRTFIISSIKRPDDEEA